MTSSKRWVCNVCGYVHDGDEPPDRCPVCDAPSDDFRSLEVESSPVSAKRRWHCRVCGYEHEGDKPPEECPVCCAGPSEFELIAQAGDESARGNASDEKFVILGAGIAGLSAAEAIRTAAPGARTVMITAENLLPYYRINLTRYLGEEVSRDSLLVHDRSWYTQRGIELVQGASVASIDTAGRDVTLTTGRHEAYDKLIYALGAESRQIPIPGRDKDGVIFLRTYGDAEAIIKRIAPGRTCVVIGGGILGLEAAAGIARRGAKVIVMERNDRLMPLQLNERASELLAKRFDRIGVSILVESRPVALLGDSAVSGVRLDDDRVMEAETVVICAGLQLNVQRAVEAGLKVNQGVVVDNRMQTSDTNIFAAGDVAEHAGICYGLWTTAMAQGTVAGACAAGETRTFERQPLATALKVLGWDVVSVGRHKPEPGDRLLEEERGDKYYRFIGRGQLLLGAVLLGDGSMMSAAQRAIADQIDLSDVLKIDATVDRLLDRLREI